MKTDAIERAVAQLKAEAHRLFNEEIAEAPGKPARLAQARTLNTQYQQIEVQVNQLHPRDSKLLLLELEDIHRDLIFLLASDDGPGSEPKALDASLEAQMQQLSHDSLALATRAGLNPAPFADEARALQQRLTAIVKGPGGQAQAIQNMASDVGLELDYILLGGNVPTSTRHAAILRNQAP